jgi:transcriptional regulator with XRE-family HTH domain
MAAKETDPVMKKVRKAFEQSGKTLDAVGLEMGSSPGTARAYAWQFLNKVDDPRISSLRKFAKAVGVSLKELV